MGKPDDKQRPLVAGRYMKGLTATRTTLRAGHSKRTAYSQASARRRER
ncbi:MAG TPA: hypothetical protein VGR18_07855 [Rubrobacter sp.]|nr:hypothetical protein [Rubrobacter sp.]